MQNLGISKIDVLLASENFEVDTKALPARCSFAYFVESMGIESFRDKPAICKFQKAELIYKQILSIYSEKATDITGVGINDGSTRIVSFVSASGGVGTTTLAVACAQALVNQGKKVLYINLEQFGDAGLYFSGEGKYTFSDVIFALRSQKSNLTIKLESTVRQDQAGVYYYACPEIALDMLDLRVDDVKRLLTELRISGGYDFVITDSFFRMDEMSLTIWKEVDSVVLVTDGETNGIRKLERMSRAFQEREKGDEALRFDKAMLLYNKYSNKTSKKVEGLEISELGGIQKYEGALARQIAVQIANMTIFNKLC